MSLYVDIEKDLGGFRLSARFQAEDEVMGILGASGCGKSTTLRCIAGIMKPDRGRIVLNGKTMFDSEKKIDLPPQKRRMGLLFQNYALFPNMTVEKNLMMGLKAWEKDRTRARKAAAEMAERFCLTGLEAGAGTDGSFERIRRDGSFCISQPRRDLPDLQKRLCHGPGNGDSGGSGEGHVRGTGDHGGLYAVRL